MTRDFEEFVVICLNWERNEKMFAEQKKDFYSVNADIAIEANQQQRNFEYNTRAGMIQQEYQTMGMGNNFDDS